jgi:hypothetical protein
MRVPPTSRRTFFLDDTERLAAPATADDRPR